MIGVADIGAALGDLGIERDDTVFVHVGMQSALRVAGEGPEGKLRTILDGLGEAVADGVLVLPTFTYSYTRGEPFDVARSASTVGVVTERFRLEPGVRRTTEPNFSCAVRGELAPAWAERLLGVGDSDAFGEESVFALVRERAAKLLFFGIGFDYCTYVHHVEQRIGVPYRYIKEFHGVTIHGTTETPTVARYFVRRLDDDVETYLRPLADELLRRGRAVEGAFPRGPRLLLTDTVSVDEVVGERTAEQPSFLLRRGHPEAA